MQNRDDLNKKKVSDNGAFNRIPKVLLNYIFEFFPRNHDPNNPKKLNPELRNLRLTNKSFNEVATTVCKNKHLLFKSPFITKMVKADDEYFAVSNLSYYVSSYWAPYSPSMNELAERKRLDTEEQLATVYNATHFYLFKTQKEALAFRENLPEAKMADSHESRVITKAVIKKHTKLLELSYKTSILDELHQQMHEKFKECNEAVRKKLDQQLLFKLWGELEQINDKIKNPQNYTVSNLMLRAERADLKLIGIYTPHNDEPIAYYDENYVREESKTNPTHFGQKISDQIESKCIIL